MFALSLSWACSVLGLVLRTPSTASAVGSALLIPLTFASNVFVEAQTLPGWLQAFVRVNPVAHLVTAARGAMDGTLTGGQVGWVLVASAAFALVFGSLAIRLYQRLQ